MALLLCLAGLALGVSIVYTFWLNPEVAFFKSIAEKKLSWSEKMTREEGKKLVIYGGSSCLFSIDAIRLLRERHLPAVNAGLGAGMGARVLTQFAFSQAKRGDTLVVALEPDLLADSLEPPSLGIQFSMAMGHPEWLDGLDAPRFPRLNAVLALHPGGFHFFTLIGKCFSGKPLYRYSAAEVDAAGWEQTPIRLPVRPLEPPKIPLTMAVKQWLKALKDDCGRKGILPVYSLPWGFVPPESLPQVQNANIGLLLEIMEFMPVLKDPRLGCYSNKESFADTCWHLVPVAAGFRTGELADQIQNQRFWLRPELVSLVSQEVESERITPRRKL